MILTVCLAFTLAVATALPNSFDGGKSKPLSSGGNVACGPVLDPLHLAYASLGPAHYVQNGNPNKDPVCGQCVEVSSNGQKLTLPVFDKCMECEANDVYLSAVAFQQLANSNYAWQIDNVSWKFAPCLPPPTTPAPQPTEKPIAFDGDGVIQWYSTPGSSACGGFVNASEAFTVAVSELYFVSGTNDPTNDPICGKCVQVDFFGNSVNVPIKEKCGGCPENKIMLSLPAMIKLRGPQMGLDNINAGSWKVAPCA